MVLYTDLGAILRHGEAIAPELCAKIYDPHAMQVDVCYRRARQNDGMAEWVVSA